MKFIENYPINKIILADYNPREISSSEYQKLVKSIKKLGFIKPIILNGSNNILVAGHQRIKVAKQLHIKNVPAIILSDISKSDEIMFNLFHNSIETNNSEVKINNFKNIPNGYSWIKPSDISFNKNERPLIVKEIGKLIMKYGAWGSVICDNDGNILYNNEYAIACKLLNENLLIYKLDKTKNISTYLYTKYGEYCYKNLKIKDYNQTYCQITRLAEGNIKKSTTYEKYVLPNITKTQRILDFGAGKCKYPIEYNKKGYLFSIYEPFFRPEGKNELDINQTIKFINEIENNIAHNGLYDVVVLDSVLNSVTTNEMEHNILLSCNALLKNSGQLILGTRNIGSIARIDNAISATSAKRELEFLDKDNFSATFRNGVWTKQKFHSKQSLEKLLSKYFKKVEIFGGEKSNCIYAICKYPKKMKITDYQKALNTEFNMLYPNNFRHNKHKKLIQTILNCHQKINSNNFFRKGSKICLVFLFLAYTLKFLIVLRSNKPQKL